jgi:hypothetical protein
MPHLYILKPMNFARTYFFTIFALILLKFIILKVCDAITTQAQQICIAT